ncbi:MAG: 50S ribosomal protein L23 [Ktedonobacteraceae bacterium]
MEITEVLRHGIVTEKTVKLQDPETHGRKKNQSRRGQYTFAVALEANKIDVRRAVETIFKVRVVSVNIMRMPGKKRMLRRKGAAPKPIEAREWKKAIVTLREGDAIDALKA